MAVTDISLDRPDVTTFIRVYNGVNTANSALSRSSAAHSAADSWGDYALITLCKPWIRTQLIRRDLFAAFSFFYFYFVLI